MNIYDFKVKNRDGKDVPLSTFKGKVMIIVNTATGCGFTPQYEGLENMYKQYHDKGLEILDFPCNQFGHQAPGTDDEIHQFCTLKYDTTFDQYAKTEVVGEGADPLFKYLCKEKPTEEVLGMKNKLAMKAVSKISPAKAKGEIKWNFTKFLIDRDGNVVDRFAPTTTPKEMEAKVKELIG